MRSPALSKKWTDPFCVNMCSSTQLAQWCPLLLWRLHNDVLYYYQDIIRMCLQVDLTPPSDEKVILPLHLITETDPAITSVLHVFWEKDFIGLAELVHYSSRETCGLVLCNCANSRWENVMKWPTIRLCTVEVITQFACVGSLGLIMGVLAMELCLTLAS